MTSRLPRVPLALLALLAAPALAQNAWQLDDPETFSRRKTEAAPEKKPGAPAKTPDATKDAKTPPPAMSPNRILGRILWADTKAGVCVVTLDTAPADRAAHLVARTQDCRPRAVLAPLPSRQTGRTAAYRVTRGVAAKDLEIVLPSPALLNTAVTTLPAAPESPKAAAVR